MSRCVFGRLFQQLCVTVFSSKTNLSTYPEIDPTHPQQQKFSLTSNSNNLILSFFFSFQTRFG